MLKGIMDRESGAIVVSIMLGLGLAAVFRAACKGGRCVVIKGPPISQIRDTVYRIDDRCYKYTPFVVPCGQGSNQRATSKETHLPG
jgi:hypothetical protein